MCNDVVSSACVERAIFSVCVVASMRAEEKLLPRRVPRKDSHAGRRFSQYTACHLSTSASVGSGMCGMPSGRPRAYVSLTPAIHDASTRVETQTTRPRAVRVRALVGH